MISSKIVHTRETERKFLVKKLHKNKNWDREFLIVQWYPGSGDDEGEKKFKLIFDLLNGTVRYVSVTKFRKSNLDADKKVEYFTKDDLDIHSFLGSPFLIKLRSICDDIHLDYFIMGKKAGSYLLELEQVVMDFSFLTDVKIQPGKEVTNDECFRNQNMCVPFTENHVKDLISTLRNFKFI